MALKSEVNAMVRSWGEDVLNSSEWLFAYEVLTNRWHNRYVNVPLPDNNELIEHMKEGGVTFLDTFRQVVLPPAFRKHMPTEPEEDEEDWIPFDFLAKDAIESESSDDDVDTASNSDWE